MPKGIVLCRFPPSQYLPEEVFEGFDDGGELAGGYSMVGHVPNPISLCIVWVHASQAVAQQINNDNTLVVIGVIGQVEDISERAISEADQTRIKTYLINRGVNEATVNAADISNAWKLVQAGASILNVDPQEVRQLLEAQEA